MCLTSEPSSAKTRPTSRHRWHSSGSASEHITATLCRAAASMSRSSPEPEFRRRGHLLVVGHPVRVERGTLRPAAELPAEKHIFDASRG